MKAATRIRALEDLATYGMLQEQARTLRNKIEDIRPSNPQEAAGLEFQLQLHQTMLDVFGQGIMESLPRA